MQECKRLVQVFLWNICTDLQASPVASSKSKGEWNTMSKALRRIKDIAEVAVAVIVTVASVRKIMRKGK